LIGVDGGAAKEADGGVEIDIEGGAETDMEDGVEIAAFGEAVIDTDEAGHFRTTDERAIREAVQGIAKAIRDIAKTARGVMGVRDRDPPDVEGRALLGTEGPGVPDQRNQRLQL